MKALLPLLLLGLTSCGDPSEYVQYSTAKKVEVEIVEKQSWTDTLNYQLQSNQTSFIIDRFKVKYADDALYVGRMNDSLTAENSLSLVYQGYEKLNPHLELFTFTGSYRGNHHFLFATSSEVKVLMQDNNIIGLSQRLLGTAEIRLFLKERDIYHATYLSDYEASSSQQSPLSTN